MKLIILTLTLILCQFKLSGQIIKGQILNSKTNKPIEYVSLGIINTTFGTITDENGNFEFEVKGSDPESIVRISMIGFESQKFTLADLKDKSNEIKMIESIIKIEEVTIKPGVERKSGLTKFNRLSGWSGWGGLHVRKGYEIGTKIKLGNKPIKIKSLHVMIHRQAFDTCFLRLHIRSMKDTLILSELLRENIIVTLTNESGWASIDLKPYNIILSGDVGVTLEWLKVQGLNEDREMKIRDQMQKAYILFKNKKKQTGLYRWGTEAKWIVNKNISPTMYLTIEE